MAGCLYVLRHGKTVLDDENRSDGWLDYPLSDEGRIGLIDAQQFLKQAPVHCVVTNSLRRCAETAHIITSGMLTHPPVGVNDATRTWNLGVLIGTKKKPNRPLVKFLMAHEDQAPEGGESLNSFRKRLFSVLEQMIARVREGENILFVCSGSVVREISELLVGDKKEFDLDEGGLLMVSPNMKGKMIGKIALGSKRDADNDGNYFLS